MLDSHFVDDRDLSRCERLWMNGWMDGWMDGRADVRTDGWMDGWLNEWMDAWGFYKSESLALTEWLEVMNERTNEWMNKQQLDDNELRKQRTTWTLWRWKCFPRQRRHLNEVRLTNLLHPSRNVDLPIYPPLPIQRRTRSIHWNHPPSLEKSRSRVLLWKCSQPVSLVTVTINYTQRSFLNEGQTNNLGESVRRVTEWVA